MKKYHFTIILLLVLAVSSLRLPFAFADVSISISDSFNLKDVLKAYCTFCFQTTDFKSSGGDNDQALVDSAVNQSADVLVHVMPGMLIVGVVTYGAHRLGAHDRVLVLIFMLVLAALSIPIGEFQVFPTWVGVFTIIGLIVMFLYGRNKQTSGSITP